MAQEFTQSNPDDSAINHQRRLLAKLREGQHEVLTELNIPHTIAQYALSIAPEDVVVQEVLREPAKNRYFLWRQDVTCVPEDHTRRAFKAQLYKIGMAVNQTSASVFLPDIAAHTMYQSGGKATLFSALLDVQVVETVIRMTDEVHSMHELPGLTGLHPQILYPEQIESASLEIWAAADETDLIPAPWHQAYAAAPIKITDQ